MTKLDFEKAAKMAKIAKGGYLPIHTKYPEVPSPAAQPRPVPRPAITKPEWRNRPQIQWLKHIEAEFRSGRTVSDVPAVVLRRLADQIEAIRQNPDVRKAYWDAVNQRNQSSDEVRGRKTTADKSGRRHRAGAPRGWGTSG